MKYGMSLALLVLGALPLQATERPAMRSLILGQPPVPQEYAPAATPTPVDGSAAAPVVVSTGTPIALYQNVRYKDLDHIHPCAVPQIVQVPDPCPTGCGTQCVNVQVCMPPCTPHTVKVTRCGNRVKYDFGKYEVTITSARGRVTVDYDD